jgi:hypothetical protein
MWRAGARGGCRPARGGTRFRESGGSSYPVNCGRTAAQRVTVTLSVRDGEPLRNVTRAVTV